MLYTLKNNEIKLNVSDLGAELYSIQKNDDDYEYLWQGDPSYWKRRAPILFPIVGKLKDNEYSYNSEIYTMSQHGFARDMKFEMVEKSDHSIVFKLHHNEMSMKIYPFEFELELSYHLKKNQVMVSYSVKNLNTFTMPFSIGGHPAFNWIDTLSSEFLFNTNNLQSYTLTDQGISLHKRDLTVKDKSIEISKELFSNDALILEDISSVVYVNGDRQVELEFNGFPYLGLWSKPSGAPFICIEPWFGIADTENHNKNIMEKKGIQLLKSLSVFKAHYVIKIS